MDTEYDRMALKAVVFALHSRPETYNLGIKPDRAVHFLSRVLSTADESEKALEAASDILKLRTQERMKNVENKIKVLHQKLTNHSITLSDKRKGDIEEERNAYNERLENLQLLEKNESVSAQRRTQQVKRKIALDLIECNRVKRR